MMDNPLFQVTCYGRQKAQSAPRGLTFYQKTEELVVEAFRAGDIIDYLVAANKSAYPYVDVLESSEERGEVTLLADGGDDLLRYVIRRI